MRRINVVFLDILVGFSLIQSVHSCTIVILSNGSIVLVGNNEDFNNPQTEIWFTPHSKEGFGRVCWDFREDFGFAQDCINYRGLFIDTNALSPSDWSPDPEKSTYPENGNMRNAYPSSKRGVNSYVMDPLGIISLFAYPHKDRLSALFFRAI